MDVRFVVSQILAFVVALSFHEMAHAWAADRLGDPTARRLGRLSMNPIVHIDPLMTLLFPAVLILSNVGIVFGAAKPVPINPANLTNPVRDHRWIAAAGPIANVILVIISILMLRTLLGPAFEGIAGTGMWIMAFEFLDLCLKVNLLLATFNLIPIQPLDGSWILQSFLSGRVADAYAALPPIGFLILIGLIWWGVFGDIIRPVFRFGEALVLM